MSVVSRPPLADPADLGPGTPSVAVRTSRTDVSGELLGAIPTGSGALAFVSQGTGLVGWGIHDALRVSGPDAAGRIAQWWADHCRRFAVTDAAQVAGSGPIVFVSLGFADTDTSVAIIPRTVVGCADGVRFTTMIGVQDSLPEATEIRAPEQVVYREGRFPPTGYAKAVQVAVERICRGELDKVVLAHDVRVDTGGPLDERHLLTRLSVAYPTCWTFAVDGLLGASPEMLLRRHGRRVSSRVLAGTAWPEHDGEHTAGVVATHLLASHKELAEHRYAVRSVADTLAEVADDVRVPSGPTTLPLANLTHLVTDVTAKLPGRRARGVTSSTSALALAARLHPTAAVGGTPRESALRLIAELEPHGRGRYAAPVGWMDRHGDGDFALALRCAQLDERGATLIAGGGIVADSDPATEVREVAVKMIPIRDALEP